MATKKDPTELRIEDRLKSAFTWTPAVTLVPWEPGRDLPGTVRPEYGVYITRGEAVRAVRPEDRINAQATLRDLEPESLKKAVAGLVKGFLEAVATTGAPARRFARFPHVEAFGPAIYFPVEVGGVPARMVASWYILEAGWLITLDTALMPETAGEAA